MNEIKIQLIKSLNGRFPKHVRIAKALGLQRIRQIIVKPDTPVIRGMVSKIGYLIEIKK